MWSVPLNIFVDENLPPSMVLHCVKSWIELVVLNSWDISWYLVVAVVQGAQCPAVALFTQTLMIAFGLGGVP